jgi:hypothetical protein
MADCDTCSENWLVEVCNLATGLVRGVLQPLQMRFDVGLNEFTDAAITLSTRDIALRDVWPGLTSIYISRVAGPGASREAPVGEWAGLITDFGMSESGTTEVGLKSIDWYTTRRTYRTSTTYTQRAQTQIAKAFLDYIRSRRDSGTGPIPLFGVADTSTVLRDRIYEAWRRKNIGEAIQDLTQVINGPDWELEHHRVDGAWSTDMIFRDEVGVDRGLLLRSDIEASAYSISANIQNLATLVDAFGAGTEEDQLIETARATDAPYPSFDATPAWTDVTRRSTLQDHAQGYLESNREPAALPTVTLPGLDVDPTQLRIGDTVTADISYGAIRFNGKARVITIAWEVAPGGPEYRTLELLPLDPPSQSIFPQLPAGLDCEDCP